MDAFRAAFTDRLERMSAAYARPFDGTWVPALRWLLEPNGWEKAGEKPRPQTQQTQPTLQLPTAEQRWRQQDEEAEAARASSDEVAGIMARFRREA